jgi:hypothetical protein
MQLDLLPPQRGVQFDDPSHRYRVWSPRRGAWLHPWSVSQILTVSGLKAFDPSQWRNKLIRDGMSAVEAEAFMRQHTSHRAQVGTDVHLCIQHCLLGTPLGRAVEEEALAIFATWQREFLPRIRRVLVIEAPMVHRQWFFAGTPDLVAEVDGQWTICDWKSKQSAKKAKPSAEWIYQLAAYRALVLAQHGLEVNWALNHMCWDGGGKDVRWNRADLLHGWGAFKEAIKVHHEQRAKESPEHAEWLTYYRS